MCLIRLNLSMLGPLAGILSFPLAAQHQFRDLRDGGLPYHEEISSAMVLADFDGNGSLDCAVGAAANTVYDPGLPRPYLNDGFGSFVEVTATHLPARTEKMPTRAMVAADVDGDRDLDLVFANPGQNVLYLNDGNARFTDSPPSWFPRDADLDSAMAAADVDRDGDMDLVFTSAYEVNPVRLYLGDGTGRFVAAPAQVPSVAVIATGVVFADIEGDADQDLVLARDSQPNLVFLNDGKGFFTMPASPRLPPDLDRSMSVAAADVDGDADADLVISRWTATSEPKVLVLANDGKGFFAVVANATPVWEGNGGGPLAAADLDGDRDVDVVVTGSVGPSLVLLNDGRGRFSLLSGGMPSHKVTAWGIALGDVDRDGDQDVALALGSFAGTNMVDKLYLNDGTARFEEAGPPPFPQDFPPAEAMASGDFDSDGDTDLALGWANEGTAIRLFRNEGPGRFAPLPVTDLVSPGQRPLWMATGDVDGDRDLDLVVANWPVTFPWLYSGQNRLYLNRGDGTFVDSTATHMPVDTDWSNVVVFADVDGDGDADLLFGNTRLANRLYLNDGRGKYQIANLPSTQIWTRIATGDLDGDGDLDVIAVVGYYEPPQLFLNDGKGVFHDATAGRLSGRREGFDLALVDVDGDRDLDLVSCGSRITAGGRVTPVYLHLNDGGARFNEVTATHVPPIARDAFALSAGDFDRDGDPDVLVALREGGSGSGDKAFLRNDGSGRFADAGHGGIAGPSRLAPFLTADLDDDGDSDVLAPSSYANRVWTNLHRHLHTPNPMRIGRPSALEIHAKPGYARTFLVAVPMLAAAERRVLVPPYGALRLDITSLVPLPVAILPAPGGSTSYWIAVPPTRELAGMPVFSQAMILDPLDTAHLTNGTRDLVAR